jgi:hypothetical protein
MTTPYVLEVTRSLDSISLGRRPCNFSTSATAQAAMRRHITKPAVRRSEDWNFDQPRVPVNDLDCVLTIRAFYTVVMYLGLPLQGMWLTEQENCRLYGALETCRVLPGNAHRSICESRERREPGWGRSGFRRCSPPRPVRFANILVSLEKNYPRYASTAYMSALVL